MVELRYWLVVAFVAGTFATIVLGGAYFVMRTMP